MNQLNISCRTNDDASFVVTVLGDLDVSTLPAFREFLLALDGDVELDCARLEFIDSASLAELVLHDRRLGTTGRHLRITNLSNACWRIIETSGLVAVLNASRGQ